MKFWKRPVVRQYFHKGLLWRSKESGEVASFELFVDLLYVGVIAAIGDTASEDATSQALLHYIITYIMSCRMWADLTNMTNWFEMGDVVQRLLILIFLLCLLGFTVNIAYAFDSSYTAMVAFYLGERLLQGLYFIWVAKLVPTIRGVMVCQTVLVLITTAIWIGSIHTPYPSQLAFILPAVLTDIFGSMAIHYFMRAVQRIDLSKPSKRMSKYLERLSSHFDFYPAFNIEHRVERNNTFVTLVFGYSVLAILYQNRYSVKASNSIFGKACLSLMQAFAFNWIYFEIDLLNMKVHAIRRHYLSAWIWIFGHLPFAMGYTLAATAMSKIVLAHDCSNSDEGSLGEQFASRSLAEVSTGLRWFYCGGLAVALLFSCIISLSHIYRISEISRLTREVRLAIRCVAAIAILCLPLIPVERLQSLALIGTTCSLMIGVLIVDLYGLSQKDRQFWFGGFSPTEKKNTGYAAHSTFDDERKIKTKKNLELGHNTAIKDILRPVRRLSSHERCSMDWEDRHRRDIHIAV